MFVMAIKKAVTLNPPGSNCLNQHLIFSLSNRPQHSPLPKSSPPNTPLLKEPEQVLRQNLLQLKVTSAQHTQINASRQNSTRSASEFNVNIHTEYETWS